MAINKNALLRYNVLDRCLRNFGRKYTFDDLKEAVSDALVEENPAYGEVSTRQLREDLRFLRSEVGYSAPIITVVEGRQRYYRYEDNFSINQSPLNETEMAQLKQAISLLRKFEGRQEFEWLNELGPQLDDKLGAQDHKPIIGYDTNLDYSGAVHIPILFNAILNKRVLDLTYQTFKGDVFTVKCHPYYLKQYNGRWFLFGRNEQLNHNQWNFPLDRITEFSETEGHYKSDNTDWEDFFYDIVGVTRKDEPESEIVLEFESQALPYVLTKPLHPTQKATKLENGKLKVAFKVIPNFELETLILSYGENANILAPIELKNKIQNRVKSMIAKFG